MAPAPRSFVAAPGTPAMSEADEDAWLWGWDATPGIVSVWAEPDGRAFVWRRVPESGVLLREDVRFRPWLLLSVARGSRAPRRATGRRECRWHRQVR